MRSMSMASTLWVAPLAVLSLYLGGCSVSTTDELDIPKIEEEIQKGVKEQAGVDVTADCPNDVEIKVDYSFECEVTPDSGDKTQQAKVTIKDDEGLIEWEIV
jgi:hypothetical protein